MPDNPSCAELAAEFRNATPHRQNEIRTLWHDMQCEGELPGDDNSGGHGPKPPINP